ncbi:hypothetical protein KCU62_g4459, partial [Aureobasidium sp. EXF-3399]
MSHHNHFFSPTATVDRIISKTRKRILDQEQTGERKTYSSRDSHVVTHRSTNLPFNCLCMAERTGCPVFS